MLMSIVLSILLSSGGIDWRHGEKLPWYGPGFYGNKTACGQKMTRWLNGVAHRTLPCGTKIRIVWNGRVLDTKVVDRGPYGVNRWKIPFDLTAGAAAKLGCWCDNPHFTRGRFKWRRL
jgi:hypothetical protein